MKPTRAPKSVCKTRISRTALAAAIAFGLYSGLVQAAITVNFDDLASPSLDKAGIGGNPLGGSVYTSPQGLIFTSGAGAAGDLQHWGTGDPENAHPGFATLYKSEVDPPLVVTRPGGGLFNLISLQLAEADNTTIGATVAFTYTNAGGTFASMLTIPAASGLHSYVINQSGLTSFSLGDVDFQLDNVVYDVAAIPEPEIYVMMAVGLLLVAGEAARRRRAALPHA